MPENQTILDYFCLPWSGQAPSQMTVKRVNNCSVDAHCFSDLAFLQDLEAIKNLRRPWYKRASYSGG
jgi:hypothetical protein